MDCGLQNMKILFVDYYPSTICSKYPSLGKTSSCSHWSICKYVNNEL